MSIKFPSFPTTGKNGKVYATTSDGIQLSLFPMTKQPVFLHRGKTYENLIYLLGAGKTLLNMRPELMPVINVDGIIDGFQVTPGIAGQVNVTAGIVETDGELTSIAGNAITLSNPAVDKWCWNSLCVDAADEIFQIVKGADTADAAKTSLSLERGPESGKKPYIPEGFKLIADIPVFSTTPAVVLSSDLDFSERETGGVDYEILPNIGGCRLQSALAAIHTGGVPRPVKFSGYYQDSVLSEISTAKDWKLDAQSSSASETTLNNTYNSSEISGWTGSFNQLLADKKIIDATFKRQGHLGVRLMFPNGFYWQSAITVTPSCTNSATSYNSISVNFSCIDFPAEPA